VRDRRQKVEDVKRYRITVDGRTYEVEIDDPRVRPVTARVLGEVFRVDIEAESVRATGSAVEPVAPARVRPRASRRRRRPRRSPDSSRSPRRFQAPFPRSA
jgi:hypothetical protein